MRKITIVPRPILHHKQFYLIKLGIDFTINSFVFRGDGGIRT